MKFKDWLKDKELKEVGTSTSCIASFARPIFSEPAMRQPMPLITFEPEKKHKKKKS